MPVKPAMRTMLAWCAVLAAVTAVQLTAAHAAVAAPVSGGTLTNGVPVSGSVTTADGTSYSFAAVKGQHVTVAFSDATTSADGVIIAQAGETGSVLGNTAFQTTMPNAHMDFIVPSTGRVTVLVESDPGDDATGTFTITYAKDVTGRLYSGLARQVSMPVAGQQAEFTFTVTADQHVTVAFSNASTVDPEEGEPQFDATASGAGSATVSFSQGSAFMDFDAAESGTVTVTIVGHADDGTTGTFSVTYAEDVTGTLTAGKAKRVDLRVPGQDAELTFGAAPGQPARLTFTKAVTSDAELLDATATQPGIAYGGALFGTSQPIASFEFIVQVSGTVTVEIQGNDNDGATGTVSVTLN